jgi:hypothetical protein
MPKETEFTDVAFASKWQAQQTATELEGYGAGSRCGAFHYLHQPRL